MKALVEPEHVADVDKPGQASAGGFDVGQRKGQLKAANDLEVAADRAAELVLGAQRVVLEAADVGDTAAVEVLMERQPVVIGHHFVQLAFAPALWRKLDLDRFQAQLFVVVVVRIAVGHVAAQAEGHAAVAYGPVLSEAVVEPVKLPRAAGQGDFGAEAVQRSAGGVEVVVAAVARPGAVQPVGGDASLAAADPPVLVFVQRNGQRPAGGRTEFIVVRVIGVAFRVDHARAAQHVDVHLLGAKPESQIVDFRKGKTEGDAAGGLAGRKRRDGGARLVELGIAGIKAPGYAVVGVVGVGVVDHGLGINGAAADGKAHLAPRAQKVVLLNRDRGHQALVLRIAKADLKVAGRHFLDRNDHVDLVVGAVHGGCFHVDVVKIAQLLQAQLGAVDGGLRKPGALKLAHFAPQHLVLGLGIAAKLNAPHIDPLAGIDEEVDFGLQRVPVEPRHGVDVGKGIADVAQHRNDVVGALLDILAREGVARFNHDQRTDGLFIQNQVAGNHCVRNGVNVAFAYVGGDKNIALVGADGHLGGLNGKVEIAAVHVEGAQRLQVARQFFARVLVGSAPEEQPKLAVGFKLLAQLLFAECFVADNIDVPNAGLLAFLDNNAQVDAVARQFGGQGFHIDGVVAAAVVLLNELLLDAVQLQLVEDLAFGNADAFKRRYEIVVLDLAVAGNADTRNGRALLNFDNQHIALAFQLYVVEKSGGPKVAYGAARQRRRHGVAHFQRHVAENAALGKSQQSVDADVADAKILGGGQAAGNKQHQQQAELSHVNASSCFCWGRLCGSCPGSGKNAQQVIEYCQPHQPGDKHNTNVLARNAGRLADRRTLDPLDTVIHQMAAIQYRNGQQVDNGQRQADQTEKKQEARQTQTRRCLRHLGNGNGTGQVFQAGFPGQHAAENAKGCRGQPSGFDKRLPGGLQRTVAQNGKRPLQLRLQRVVGWLRLYSGHHPAVAHHGRQRFFKLLSAARNEQRQRLHLAPVIGAQLRNQPGNVAPAIHGLAADAGDSVAGLQSGPGSRGSVGHITNDGRQVGRPRLQSDFIKNGGFIKARRQMLQIERQRAAAAGFVFNHNINGLAVERVRHEGQQRARPGLRWRTVDGQDHVFFLHARRGGNAGRLAHHRARFGHADHEHQPEGGQRKNQVEHRAGGHHRGPPAQRLAVEGHVAHGRVDWAIVLVEHAHIAAQGNDGNAVLGSAPAAARPQGGAKSYGKLQNLYTGPPRHPEMAKLVKGDQQAKGHGQPQNGAKNREHHVLQPGPSGAGHLMYRNTWPVIVAPGGWCCAKGPFIPRFLQLAPR